MKFRLFLFVIGYVIVFGALMPPVKPSPWWHVIDPFLLIVGVWLAVEALRATAPIGELEK